MLHEETVEPGTLDLIKKLMRDQQFNSFHECITSPIAEYDRMQQNPGFDRDNDDNSET